MADPQTYERLYDFEGFQALNPKSPLPGARHNTEYDTISDAINGLVRALKDVRRSDGEIKNKSVDIDQLADNVLHQLAIVQNVPIPPGPAGPTIYFDSVDDIADTDIGGIGFTFVGGQMLTAAAAEPAHPGKYLSADNKWLEVKGPRVTIEAFGAKGDGPGTVDLSIQRADHAYIPGTDDSAAFLRALAFAEMVPGTTIAFGPKHYMFDRQEGFDIPTLTSLEGVPGKTIIDTRRRPLFNTQTPIFRAFGTTRLSGIVPLARNARRPRDLPIHLASATHSAGVITATTTTAHGLTPGTPIMVNGSPDGVNEGYAGFYHVNRRNVAPTVPGFVIDVPDTTTFTYAATAAIAPEYGTLSSQLLIYAMVQLASDYVYVNDNSAFDIGDPVLVASQAIHRSGSSESNRIGEQQKVALKIGANWIKLTGAVREDYLVSDEAKIVPIDPLEQIHVYGITFIGKGANESAETGALGDVAWRLHHVHGGSFRNCRLYHFDLMGHCLISCVDYFVENNVVLQDYYDQAGRVSGRIDIVYGLVYGHACQNVHYVGNQIYGGRHSISQNADSDSLIWGISREIWIVRNISRASFIGGFSTHQGVEDVWYLHNDVDSSGEGINIRFARQATCRGNHIKAQRDGYLFTNHFRDLEITGGSVRAGMACISIGTLQDGAIDPPVDPNRTLKISNVTALGGRYFIQAQTSVCPAAVGTIVSVEGCVVRPVLGTIISMQMGGSADAAAGWSGVFRDNTFYLGEHESGAYMFEFYNPRDVLVEGNKYIPVPGGTTAYQYGVFTRGSGSTALTVGDNPGMTENSTITFYRLAGSPGFYRSEYHLPRTQTLSADANTNWFRLSNQNGFARKIILAGTYAANRTFNLTNEYALEGDTVEIVRTGGGAGGYAIVDTNSSTTILASLAQDKTAVCTFVGTAWTLTQHVNRV